MVDTFAWHVQLSNVDSNRRESGHEYSFRLKSNPDVLSCRAKNTNISFRHLQWQGNTQQCRLCTSS